MDIILIDGLAIDTTIGVYDWEKRIQQRLILDLELGWDIRPAAADDDLNQTLNYAAISERLIEFGNSHRLELIETFAERVATLLQEEFSIPWLRLTLHKPGAVPEARSVGVRIERGQRNALP
ncbi:dihydroneopterin aldolase [Larsenimonas rhizosphaerae]|uniref:7,8-dihydroneopterin aldolase n=1 Tax=Larsenimonas rhizosphaerae TaxID=2944682 RepID=A0AA42CWP5_9GAMM|nr:dihydroneopterin aldolase [Larsenimonas rhizosphaerae]MCM2130188.1 dihydroneopterin aldolase [Larsenimonas rhizosphaerae]MCX2522875.1 dihydroneopterin aldolase [Larsenimonas rhizosphaerae]